MRVFNEEQSEVPIVTTVEDANQTNDFNDSEI